MHFITPEAGLSQRYTNHSIRSTVMGILSDEYEGREVIHWSGHATEGTIKQYVKWIPEKRKHEMSSTLASSLLPKKPDNATVSTPPPPQQQNNQLQQQAEEPIIQIQLDNPPEPEVPNFDLQFGLEEMDDAQDNSALVQLLETLEKQNAPLQQPQQLQPALAQLPAVPQVPKNVLVPINQNMNIQNVQNNNVNPNRLMPAMYFPGSTVTINYNFNK